LLKKKKKLRGAKAFEDNGPQGLYKS